MHEDFGAPISSETEARILHFIPPVELKGSRYEKLQKLDTLIVYLQQLRQSLAGSATARTPSARPLRGTSTAGRLQLFYELLTAFLRSQAQHWRRH